MSSLTKISPSSSCPMATSAAQLDSGGRGNTAGPVLSGRSYMFAEAVSPVVHGLSDEHRYLFDLNGFLHLEGALSSAELAAAQAAVAAAVDAGKQGQVWCWNKAMESLVFHPKSWPAVMELTNGKPKLKGGQMIIDDPQRGLGLVHGNGGHLHCAREDWGPESASFEIVQSQIRASDFIVFIYLTDVNEGDGGLAVLPGSHKSNFPRPHSLFGSYGLAARQQFRENGNTHVVASEMPLPDTYKKLGMTPVFPKAGDMMVMPEAMTHAVMPWVPTDRPRHVLGLRFQAQHLGGDQMWPQPILERLSANTRELLQHAHYTYTKGIATVALPTLEEDLNLSAARSAAVAPKL